MTVRFERVAPILPVRDVRAALAHYWQLGFTVTAYDEAAADPVYGFLERDGLSLHLALVPDLEPERSTVACYLYVSDADALHAAWRSANAGGRLTAVADTPYGLREFAHIDPDGNLLRVGSPMPEGNVDG
ncbi:bleomycin resistance protein [Azospirillum endophyticum]